MNRHTETTDESQVYLLYGVVAEFVERANIGTSNPWSFVRASHLPFQSHEG